MTKLKLWKSAKGDVFAFYNGNAPKALGENLTAGTGLPAQYGRSAWTNGQANDILNFAKKIAEMPKLKIIGKLPAGQPEYGCHFGTLYLADFGASEAFEGAPGDGLYLRPKGADCVVYLS